MSHRIGFVGLGRMGKNMVLHLLEGGIDAVVYNRTKDVTEEFKIQNSKFKYKTGSGELKAVYTIEEMVKELTSPRVIWLMVPNGKPVDEVIQQLLAAGIGSGDTIIDGGNCFYKDTVRRNNELKAQGITYIDCGTSGGLEGARNGACLMIGGAEEQVQKLVWLWNATSGSFSEETAESPEALAKGDGARGSWAHFGPAGAGHFVKMVHNGVEYGMNQALGEGFEILTKGPYALDLPKVAHNWAHGSVVRGWLVDLLARALDKDPKLDGFEGKVGGGSTGTWTVEAAREFGVEANVLEDSLKAREQSQVKPTFAGKVVSALRNEYGGHAEVKPRNDK